MGQRLSCTNGSWRSIDVAAAVPGAFLIAGRIGLYGIISNALHKSESTEPSTPEPANLTSPDVSNSMLMAKGKRRVDAEHTQNKQEKNRNTHEEARARKDREQKKADEKNANTKSKKKDQRYNNQRKKDNPNYKKTNDPKKSEEPKKE